MAGLTPSSAVLNRTARLSRTGTYTLSHPIVRVVTRRLAMAIPLVFVVSATSFILLSFTPGDAAQEILGPNASHQAYEQLRTALGLNKPLITQYSEWVKGAVTGRLGTSLVSGDGVAHAINARLPVTLSLMFGALLVGIVVGVSLGVFSALRGGALARLVDVFALAGFAVPAFWLGALLISIFAIKLRLFPATGYVPIGESPSAWFNSLVLPVLTLSVGGIAAIAKQTRAAMIEALASEHIRIAWANGLAPRSIFFRHALKNAALPVITVVGVQAVWLLGGTVTIETVFGMPGLGSLVVAASIQHDLPIVLGIAIYFTLIVVLIGLVTDLMYTWLNPRVRTQ